MLLFVGCINRKIAPTAVTVLESDFLGAGDLFSFNFDTSFFENE